MGTFAWRGACGLLALVLTGCGQGSTPATQDDETTPPAVQESRLERDLIFVSIDTLRADHLPFYGYERATAGDPATPFSLAWLADQGRVYDSVWAPIGKTLPSLASFWTGEFPLEHGAISNPTPLRRPTYVQSLVAQGYTAHAAVANRALGPGCGLEQGFSTYAVLPKADEPRIPRALLERARPHVSAGDPLVLWAHFMAPHQPYAPREDLAARFSERPDTPADNEALYAFHHEPSMLDEETKAAIIGLYDAEILTAADYVQEFLTGLDAAYREAGRGGLLEAATVVFFSDHGEELAERHGYFLHAKSLYRGVLQVPLVVAGPGVSVSREGAPRSLMDVLPEMLNGEPPAREWWAASWQTEFYAMRDERWTLIHNPADNRMGPYEQPEGAAYRYGVVELYDRDADPYEWVNVAEQHPDQVERLLDRMHGWYAEQDRAPVEWLPNSNKRQMLHELGYLEFADRTVPPWDVATWKQGRDD